MGAGTDDRIDTNGIEFRDISSRSLPCANCGKHAVLIADLRGKEATCCGQKICLNHAVRMVRGENKNTTAISRYILIVVPPRMAGHAALTAAQKMVPQISICSGCGRKTQIFFSETSGRFSCPNGQCGVAVKI